MSRTPHGVRGLKLGAAAPGAGLAGGRTPHGVRGLKYNHITVDAEGPESHPTRGAWIEIPWLGVVCSCPARRTPHGVRGLKLVG